MQARWLALGVWLTLVWGAGAAYGQEDALRLDLPQQEYSRVLAALQNLPPDAPISVSTFQSTGWVGRIALLNMTCGGDRLAQCQQAIRAGLKDKALVVRDHALKLMLALPVFAKEECVTLAENVLKDDRNYRRGQALWIVERARGYLSKRQ